MTTALVPYQPWEHADRLTVEVLARQRPRVGLSFINTRDPATWCVKCMRDNHVAHIGLGLWRRTVFHRHMSAHTCAACRQPTVLRHAGDASCLGSTC